MRRLGRGIVGFVIGDDVWIAAAMALLLAATGLLVHLGGEAWWVLPAGVPAALWVSLQRAKRGGHGGESPE